MNCPECGEAGYTKAKGHKKCGLAGEETGRQSKYPTITGRTDTIISRSCSFTTGDWTCQWGTWASDQEPKVYCPFHRHIFQLSERYGVKCKNSETQWEEFQKERTWNQTHRTRHSWANPDGTFPDTPFWFMPEDEAWRMLTGLPLPNPAGHSVGGQR